jgi:hypothetical protein
VIIRLESKWATNVLQTGDWLVSVLAGLLQLTKWV